MATGSVVLSGLPASGTWTITRSPGSVATTGTGTSTTISDLPAGTYTFTVMTSPGSTSNPTSAVVINAQPPTPTPPIIGDIVQPNCVVTTGTFAIEGLPATGTWTLIRNPGNVTKTGTGVSTTYTGVAPGTYTFIVINSFGCSSAVSANLVLNAASPPTITAVTKTPAICNNGTISIVASGISALEYSIDGGTTYQTNSTFTGLSAGNYNVKVRLKSVPLCTAIWGANPVVINIQANVAPSVTLTAPTDGLTTMTNVALAANASDNDGSVTQVNFYWITNNRGVIARTLIGSDNIAPYNFNWTNVAGGHYDIQAEAIDNCGTSSFSNVSGINVLPTVNVLITAPTSRTFIPGTNINIMAAVSTFGTRTITKVEFFANSVKLGEDATAPYSYLWTNVPAGSYALQAVATDNAEGVWSSPSVYIVGTSGGSFSSNSGSESKNELSFDVSPNPASTSVLMKAHIENEGNYTLSIVNSIGQAVLTQKMTYVKGVQSERLDVSNLPKGVYIIQLVHTDGKDFVIQKLVIE